MTPTPPHHTPGRCPTCGQRPRWCFCDRLGSCASSTSFVVVRHWKELSRSSSSARLVAACVPEASVLDWGSSVLPFDEELLRRPGTWLLFPDGHDGLGQPVPELRAHRGMPVPPPQHIVVADGSWSQARKIVRRVEALRAMPRFTVDPGQEPATRLREPPVPGAMATAEAVARCIEILEGPEAARPLREAYDLLVAAVIAAGGGTGGQSALSSARGPRGSG